MEITPLHDKENNISVHCDYYLEKANLKIVSELFQLPIEFQSKFQALLHIPHTPKPL